MNAADDYGAKDITVLEGLEAVRKRPGMYIGSTGVGGLHHLVYEVVDNAIDEAMAGFCDTVEVTLLPSGGCEVRDNGRGIPVDVKPEYGVSAAELVLGTLHAGGKFGGEGYKVSGGLHGVGVSVVNALSSKVEVEIDRGGQRHTMAFRDGGTLSQSLRVSGTSPQGRRGTTVRFWPDDTIFDTTQFVARTLLERFEMMAFLNRGVTIHFRDQREPELVSDTPEVVYHFEGGIIDFVRSVNSSKAALFQEVGYYHMAEDDQEVEVAFQWNQGYNTDGVHSFANGINTIEGGQHVEGFRAGLTRVINTYAAKVNKLKEGQDPLGGEDIREGLTAIVAVRLREPQFEGQTKGKLGNVSVKSLVQKATYDQLGVWLEEHPKEGKAIVDKALLAQRAREEARKARDIIRRKSAFDGAGMPDKLKDCSSKNPEESELFIVEGDSAGGSALRAREPRYQAILPIRGKILNVERARVDKMLRNAEVQTLITAIGGGLGDDFDVTKARYHKVIILADADVDGSHIRTLLLTFFFRQMRSLVEAGYVYIAQPPLYSTEVGKEKIYLKDDAARAAFLAERPNHKAEFQRLKGLGEMDWEELRDTTISADLRTLLQVSVEQAAIADEITSILMGDDVESRKQFIVTNAREVRNLDF